MSEEYQNTDAESTSIGICQSMSAASYFYVGNVRRSLAVRLITVVTQVQL